MFIGEDRRFVMYPCSNNELLNFVVIHPSSESEASDGKWSILKQTLRTLKSDWLTDNPEWNAGGSKENLGKIFKDFGPRIAALISHVDDKSLKLWSLLDMEVLPTWVSGRLALMGDAAHPFLPRK